MLTSVDKAKFICLNKVAKSFTNVFPHLSYGDGPKKAKVESFLREMWMEEGGEGVKTKKRPEGGAHSPIHPTDRQ